MGKVLDYYLANFDSLPSDKKFHFATRIKNWFQKSDPNLAEHFNEFLSKNEPSHDFEAIYEDNDFSNVNELERRRPFFEKYDHLYSIEATLFRVHHLLAEYDVDLRPELEKLVSQKELRAMSEKLLADDEALTALSTFAVNVICLTAELFPTSNDLVAQLAEKSLVLNGNAYLMIYLYAHIILCDTVFYKRPVKHPELARRMLDRCKDLIEEDFDELPLDVKIEFLVCDQIVREKDGNYTYPDLKQKIFAECAARLKHAPFLTDLRKPERLNTLAGAEHRNVLFILSGLDSR